jgi:hypothetical protein
VDQEQSGFALFTSLPNFFWGLIIFPTFSNAIVNGCIIGLDRNFNASSCYITVVCFKNKNVIKKNTSELLLNP